jgi:hypothetical protein
MKNNIVSIFNGFLDSNQFNQAIMLSSYTLSEDSKLEILDDLSFRLQIQFGKRVVFVTNKAFYGDVDVVTPKINVSEVPLLYPNRDKVVFIVNIDFPYFENKLSWESKIVETLIYYKYVVFGFISGEQRVKFYEEY